VLKGTVKRGALVTGRLLFLSLTLLFLFFCAGTPRVEISQVGQIIKNVPFYPQEKYQCGPASLAGILNFWGVTVLPEEIASEIYSRSARGTVTLDTVLYSEKKGLKASPYEGSFEDIKKKIDAGHPLIVMVDEGFWIYQKEHFMVVLGYYEKGVIVNSGKNQYEFIPLSDFLKSWGRTGHWTLLITPGR
jgi:ABC-type bacteriocin/lantibiotic exporter with double-glycine peptidase domain